MCLSASGVAGKVLTGVGGSSARTARIAAATMKGESLKLGILTRGVGSALLILVLYVSLVGCPPWAFGDAL